MSATTCTTFMVNCVEYEHNYVVKRTLYSSHVYTVTEKEMLSTPIWRIIPLLLYRYYIQEPCTHHLKIDPATYVIVSVCVIVVGWAK